MSDASEIRVLYYIAYYQRMAGANRSLFELVTHLPKTVRPLVVLAGEGLAAQAYRSAGVEVKILPLNSALNQFGKAMLKWSVLRQGWVGLTELLPYTLQLKKVIEEFAPHVVHVNDPRGALLAGTAAKLAGAPVVGHMRGEPTVGGVSWLLFEKLCDRIITVCSAIQPALDAWAQPKAITVYNGIEEIPDGNQIVPWLEALKAQGQLVVSCFASIVPFKGHHHLIDAIAQLNQRGWGDRAVFLCIGDFVPEYAAHQQWLRRRQQALGVENLLFLGWKSNPFPFYEAADIEVLPSVSQEVIDYGDRHTLTIRGNEGFPRTHLEAMYFNLPIVGTAIAGVHEQIENGVNGFVVPPADATALAEAIEKLLANPDLRSQMGQAGSKRVQQQFSTAASVAGVLKVYQSLISDGQAEDAIAPQVSPVS